MNDLTQNFYPDFIINDIINDDVKIRWSSKIFDVKIKLVIVFKWFINEYFINITENTVFILDQYYDIIYLYIFI